jgi:hypothetical protein
MNDTHRQVRSQKQNRATVRWVTLVLTAASVKRPKASKHKPSTIAQQRQKKGCRILISDVFRPPEQRLQFFACCTGMLGPGANPLDERIFCGWIVPTAAILQWDPIRQNEYQQFARMGMFRRLTGRYLYINSLRYSLARGLLKRQTSPIRLNPRIRPTQLIWTALFPNNNRRSRRALTQRLRPYWRSYGRSILRQSRTV